MQIFKHVQVLIGLALVSAAGVAVADTDMADTAKPEAPAAAQEAVVIIGSAQSSWSCNEATRERARSLADKALKDGEYERAGHCYLAAGEQALADQAFVKALVQTSPDTSHRLAANLDEVKAQARQIKDAFRHR